MTTLSRFALRNPDDAERVRELIEQVDVVDAAWRRWLSERTDDALGDLAGALGVLRYRRERVRLAVGLDALAEGE